jgi:hypothetical protein
MRVLNQLERPAAPRHVGIVAGVEDLRSNLIYDPATNARFQPANKIEADVGDFVHPPLPCSSMGERVTPAVGMSLGPGCALASYALNDRSRRAR